MTDSKQCGLPALPAAGLLTIAVCAVMAGASSFTAIVDWLHDLDDIARARLGFVRGVPATSTMWRLLTRLDADLLARVLAGWLLTRTGHLVTPRPPRYRRVPPTPGVGAARILIGFVGREVNG